jgi:hypothetical protein
MLGAEGKFQTAFLYRGKHRARLALRTLTGMKYSAKVIGIIITLRAVTATVPRLLAQPTQAGAPQSATSGRSPLGTQLGVSVYPKNNQDQGQQGKNENHLQAAYASERFPKNRSGDRPSNRSTAWYRVSHGWSGTGCCTSGRSASKRANPIPT